MGRSRYRVLDEGYIYFVTSTIAGNYPLFCKQERSGIILDSLKHLSELPDMSLHAYVIMPDHVHLMISGDRIPDKIRSFKSFTAASILKELKQKKSCRVLRHFRNSKLVHKKHITYQVWQEGYHPKAMFDDEATSQVLEYIHNNPVVAGFVDDPVAWRLSSARNYNGLEGEVPIDLIDRL